MSIYAIIKTVMVASHRYITNSKVSFGIFVTGLYTSNITGGLSTTGLIYLFTSLLKSIKTESLNANCLNCL